MFGSSARPAVRFAVVLSTVVSLHIPLAGAAYEDWLTIPLHTDLRIQPYTALDFSQSTVVPATPAISDANRVTALAGKLAITGKPQRFMCATWAFSNALGLMPDAATSAELAVQLKRHGYNLVRFHLVDQALIDDTGAIDPEQTQRFHLFLQALRAQGIRWMFDVGSSDDGGWGSGEHALKLELHYDKDDPETAKVEGEDRQVWLDMLDRMYHLPYDSTGGTILNDPATAAVTLYNELGIRYNTSDVYATPLQHRFVEWAQTEGYPPVVPLPTDRTVEAARMMKFLTWKERETSDWLSAQLRDRGYQGLISAYNNGKFIQSAMVRQHLPLQSLHGYQDIPKERADGTRVQDGYSSLQQTVVPLVRPQQDLARYFAAYRYLDRPVVVDEYNVPWWSGHRREIGVAMPAYAAFQGLDAICRYNNPIALEYGDGVSGPSRTRALHSYSVALDPVARAGETLAVLLHRRGDVQEGAKAAAMVMTDAVNPEASFAHSRYSGMREMPESYTRLALVAKTGLLPQGTSSTYPLTIVPDAAYAGPSVDHEVKWQSYLSTLRNAGVLRNNRTGVTPGTYQSSTNQILLEAEQQRITVVTPRTEAIAAPAIGAPVLLSKLKLLKTSAPAMISVSSLAHDRTLSDATRMLLIVATDAVNTGTEIATDAEGKSVLVNQGQLPVKLQPVQLQLQLAVKDNRNFKLAPLHLNGVRQTDVPAGAITLDLKTSGLVKATIDTGALTHPTTFFELYQ